jgi:hypothetical protein
VAVDAQFIYVADRNNHRVQVWSIAANDAHPMIWCRIQKLCINSGEGQYGQGTDTARAGEFRVAMAATDA